MLHSFVRPKTAQNKQESARASAKEGGSEKAKQNKNTRHLTIINTCHWNNSQLFSLCTSLCTLHIFSHIHHVSCITFHIYKKECQTSNRKSWSGMRISMSMKVFCMCSVYMWKMEQIEKCCWSLEGEKEKTWIQQQDRIKEVIEDLHDWKGMWHIKIFKLNSGKSR